MLQRVDNWCPTGSRLCSRHRSRLSTGACQCYRWSTRSELRRSLLLPWQASLPNFWASTCFSCSQTSIGMSWAIGGHHSNLCLNLGTSHPLSQMANLSRWCSFWRLYLAFKGTCFRLPSLHLSGFRRLRIGLCKLQSEVMSIHFDPWCSSDRNDSCFLRWKCSTQTPVGYH